MTVDASITTPAGFATERESWERLYAADPHRHVFMSWAWLDAYLYTVPPGWTIAVFREGDELIAALPLQVRSVPSRALPVARELAFAGDPVADYGGMLCRPGREADAVRAFAATIQTLGWDRAAFRDDADPRLDALLTLLQPDGRTFVQTGETRCLRTTLPASWDDYKKSLGRTTRGKTARSLRRLQEALPRFRVSSPSDADVDAHVEAMVRVNHARWGGNLRSARARFGRLFRAAYDRGCLRLHVAWDGERAIAGVASFTDPVGGTYNLYQLGYDDAYAKFSPGKAVLGHAIRDAIERGYQVFDFLRGDEEYKASYAAEVLITRHFYLGRPVLRSALFDLVQPSYRALKAAAARVVYGPRRTLQPMEPARAHVTRFSTLEAFEAERGRWEELERQDPHATVFTSWRWLRAYLPVTRFRWSILALRDGERAVAYLPIAYGGSLLDRELYLGGNPTADYTGMLALRGHDEAAIAAFADALAAEPWDAFNALDVRDPRIESLVRRLVERGYALESTGSTLCLTARLPATWEEFAAHAISAKTRINTVRVERRLAAGLHGFRISEPCDADIEEHIEAMVQVNHARWGGNLSSARRRYGGLFRNAYAGGILRLFLYRDGAKPIAGAAAFIDEMHSSFGLYMIGFDEEYERFSPGKGIVGRAIRAAIESGYERFDFLRGDEPFKASYAKELHATQHFRLTAPGLRSAALAYGRPKFFALKMAVANLVYGPGRMT